ncbi:MAG: phosphatidate cytidylyltransferase [Oscillospiraceae bacterium]|nr:phosphatidate cytidylyltransferase [Oscillospiraceae bacterium]
MKQRLITAMIGLVVLFAVLFCYNTIVLNIAISIIGAIAVYELLHSTGYVKSKLILLMSFLYALVVPFFSTLDNRDMQIWVTLAYFCVLFAVLLIRHQRVQFQEVSTAFFVSLLLPMALAMLVLMRDRSVHGIFYGMLVCVASWIADSAAYFVGRAFGRHKLAPQISPNKTIEGAVGGVVFSALFFMLFCAGYRQVMIRFFDMQIEIAWFRAFVIGMICTFMGIIGDLMASVVKRQTGIKDFGNIMPGHGGIMDRFDSFLFVTPTLYLALQLFPIIA